jgi:lysophospholipase L1-like esterase
MMPSPHAKIRFNVLRVAYIGDSTGVGLGANGADNFEGGNPYSLNLSGYPTEAQQLNTDIPSAVRLLRTYIEGLNPESTIHNYSVPGWRSVEHISNGTVDDLTEKYDFALVALGINSAKNNETNETELRQLISQLKVRKIQPVLVLQNNVGVAYSPSGVWVEESLPSEWYPMDDWLPYRAMVTRMAGSEGIDIIDLGTVDGVLDTSLLHDSFHPNAAGYYAMFEKLKIWVDGLPK